MRNVGLIFILCMFATPILAYRFICNGILATGEDRGDDCGICDDAHAARWENPNIPVVVDSRTLPRGIGKADWAHVVKNSFAAWNDVSGANLRFVPLRTTNARQFGTNDSIHEIFWITDKAEWRSLVGTGEFGTLGATLPRYTCGGGAPRVIFDADLVLNGLPHINWQMDCHDDDCVSVQTTLVHELGHFFGLDHPCLFCGTSIMSARAGYDLDFPVFDDVEGLRALYPDQSIGLFGSACVHDQECANGFTCIDDGQNNYCSRPCTYDADCAMGAICENHDSKKMCEFIDGEAAMGRREGDNCVRVPCIEPLVCAGPGDPNYYCFLPCGENQACRSGQECITLPEGTSICVGIKQKGERCSHNELCEKDLFCVFESPHSGYCRAGCVASDTSSTGCESHEICQRIEGTEVCTPYLELDDPTDPFGLSGPIGSGQEPFANTDAASGCSNTRVDGALWLVLSAFILWLRRNRVLCHRDS